VTHSFLVRLTSCSFGAAYVKISFFNILWQLLNLSITFTSCKNHFDYQKIISEKGYS